MRLFFSPGACSLAPHIALREIEAEFQLVQVDLKEKKTKGGVDFLSINPKGYVPTLETDDGQIITENAVILQFIADQKPDAGLAPKPGTFERIRLQEWLNFIATELHKTLGPINHPKANQEIKEVYRARLDLRFSILARGVQATPYLLGERFTVADVYAYYVLRGLQRLDPAALDKTAPLRTYFERLGARASVRAALGAEGLI